MARSLEEARRDIAQAQERAIAVRVLALSHVDLFDEETAEAVLASAGIKPEATGRDVLGLCALALTYTITGGLIG